jgi:hypothetical protein
MFSEIPPNCFSIFSVIPGGYFPNVHGKEEEEENIWADL